MCTRAVRLFRGRWSPQSRRLSDDPTCRHLVDVCRRRGFLLGEASTSSCVVGGAQSLGPLGIAMKRQLLGEWWDVMVLRREQVLPVSTPYCPAGERTDLLQGVLQNYLPCLELLNRKLPFGIAELGRCFQPITDEETPRVSRTVAALGWFCSPRTSDLWRDHWLRHRLLWWQRFAQSPSRFSSSEHPEEGRRLTHIQYHFPWGKQPIESLRSMDDSALTQLHCGTTASLQGRDGRKSLVPHVVWLSADVERGMLAYLSDALQVTGNPGPRGKEQQQRTVLKIHPSLAPIKVAVDVGKGPAADLRLVCQGLSAELREKGISVWPGYLETSHTPMEQLFTKYDEMGVLFTVLISDVTLESGLLHLRNRDTTIRETAHISKLPAYLTQHMTAAKRL